MNVVKNETTEIYLNQIIHHIIEKKGENIVVIDLRGITSITDYFIIATGTSNIHLKAIADEIREKLKKENNIIPWHTEGYETKKWILLDYVNVVVHIFDSDMRSYYSLEKLWDDAEIKHVETENY